MSGHAIPVEELKKVCAKVDGDCALYVSVPDTGERFVLNGDMIFSAASTIKIPMLALLFKDAEEGRVDLSKKIVVKPDNRVIGSGILRSLSPDLELSLFDLANLMIVMSDNTATNEVADAVGMDRVRQFCLDNGYNNTWMWKKMFFKGYVPEPQILEGAPVNATTANDLGRMMESIAAGKCVSEKASDKMVQIMAGQRLARLKTLLPCAERVEPFAEKLELPAEGKVVAASKGGTLTSTGIAHDAAIFYLPDGRYYVMVMCTRSSSVDETTKIINEAGLVMYEAMK